VYREKVDRAAYGSMDEFRQQAWNMILSPAVREAFDLSKEPSKLVEAYGDNAFGQSVLMSRRLVEAGARFVTAAGYNFQSWDEAALAGDSAVSEAAAVAAEEEGRPGSRESGIGD
jgi:hypothetical protein